MQKLPEPLPVKTLVDELFELTFYRSYVDNAVDPDPRSSIATAAMSFKRGELPPTTVWIEPPYIPIHPHSTEACLANYNYAPFWRFQ
jgi:hypothetical protein